MVYTARPGPLVVVLALLVLGAGITVSGLWYRSIESAENLRLRDRLNTASRSVRDAFESDLARTVQAVEGAALYATLQERLTPQQWHAYGAGLLQRVAQVQALEWTPRVPATAREGFERAVRRQGLPGFRILEPDGSGRLQPAAARPLYLPVLYSEPPAPRLAGLDRAASTARREAAQLARDNGTTVASAPSGDTCVAPHSAAAPEADRPAAGTPASRFRGADPCLAVTAASYRGHEPAQLLDRRARSKGFVSAVVRYRDLLREAVRRADAEQLDLWLYDLSGERVLLLAYTGATPPAQEAAPAQGAYSAYAVLAAERSWELVFRPRPAFFTHLDRRSPGLAVALGTAVTLLLLGALLAAHQVFRVTALARAAAEAAARSKSEFLANISHEIRTPMHAIIGLSALALKTEMSPKLFNYLRTIRHSGEHLLGLVNDILDFSRIESGKLEIEALPFHIDTVVDHVVNLLAEETEAKGLQLHCSVDPQLHKTLVGDPLRIGQVLINLANNAVKFTPQGEVWLSVRLQQAMGSALLLCFEVRDTGIGLTPEQAGRLFHSFAQADSSISRQFGGSGLGLAISKSLVEAMGGEIGVRSVHGQGSTFWFTVRLLAGQDSPPVEAGDAVPVPRDPLPMDAPMDALKDVAVPVADAEPADAAVQKVQQLLAQDHPRLAALWSAHARALRVPGPTSAGG